MKKIFLTLLTLCFVASYGFCSTVNSYDSYGRKTGSYRTSGSTTTSYDKYGRKTGTIKQTSSGYATYDNMGRKTSTVKTIDRIEERFGRNKINVGFTNKDIPNKQSFMTSPTMIY